MYSIAYTLAASRRWLSRIIQPKRQLTNHRREAKEQ